MSSAIKSIKNLGFPWETQDPFLFCVYHEDHYPEANESMGPNTPLAGRMIGNDFQKKDGFRMYHGATVPGFPAHPHRGFETVTIVRQGLVDHSDSMGAAGRFGHGDVQWMTAGKGVQHSEMFPLMDTENPNTLELFQIWLNLPANKKFVEPHFKMLWSNDIPKPVIKDSNGHQVEIGVVAGRIVDTEAPTPAPDSWASDSANEVAIVTLKLEPNASFVLPTASMEVNRSLYFFKGDHLTVDGQPFSDHKAIELDPSQPVTLVNGDEETELLLLQGKPLNEPVVQHGPFVMNTREQINETMQDYQRTQFGGWPWPKYDNVHGKEKGRFAYHADGRKEELDL